MMDDLLFPTLRAAHILLAALWLGAAFLLSIFVLPAVRDAGTAGGHFMATLHRRKLHVFMAASAVLTVLSGVWLYWVLTSGLERAALFSRTGIVFGIGGLCGVLALALGASVIGPGAARMVELVEQTAATPEADRGDHLQRIQALQQRTACPGQVAVLLLLLALILMVSGHYV